jgi:small subunit ribosomal protein S8
MTMTDPIADMLTRLRNANSAYHDTAAMPYSKIKSHIAEILQQEGYIAGWTVEDAEVGRKLVVNLKYGNSRERCTRRRTTCPRFWAAWASRSSRRPADC